MTDDPRILRVITVGLILAALAVAYFLLTGGLAPKAKKVQTQNTQVAGVSSPEATALPIATQSAYSRIVERNQANVQTLPATSFPAGLAVVFSVGTLVSGYSLRKYPN